MCCLAVEPDKGLIKTDAIFLIRHLEEHVCVFLTMPAEINLSFLKDLDVLWVKQSFWNLRTPSQTAVILAVRINKWKFSTFRCLYRCSQMIPKFPARRCQIFGTQPSQNQGLKRLVVDSLLITLGTTRTSQGKQHAKCVLSHVSWKLEGHGWGAWRRFLVSWLSGVLTSLCSLRVKAINGVVSG